MSVIITIVEIKIMSLMKQPIVIPFKCIVGLMKHHIRISNQTLIIKLEPITACTSMRIPCDGDTMYHLLSFIRDPT